ncbi:MAG: hypothetical protein HY784_10230, partial [Chloroflexi bacterium]|nr:hypothetical protein [Chloroflexota bacterium]
MFKIAALPAACPAAALAGLVLLQTGPNPPSLPPPPVATPTPDRAARPTRPANPGQADRGALLYWSICMACHGDRGQGLTDEWRAASGPQDSNCWQSKCHASNHPPQGFELPRSIPAVTGPGALARFASAQDLHDYLARTMPWWNPGSLTGEQTWELTAYLLWTRQALPAGITLDATSAGALPVNAPAAPRGDQRTPALLLAGPLALVASGLVWLRRGESGAPPPRRPTFFQHLHPPTIPAAQARWRYTLGAGGLSAFLILVLIVTSALEMLSYTPSVEEAALSVQRLTYLVPYGGLVRNLHYWATQALLLT